MFHFPLTQTVGGGDPMSKKKTAGAQKEITPKNKLPGGNPSSSVAQSTAKGDTTRDPAVPNRAHTEM
jgi:hypothetical protein